MVIVMFFPARVRLSLPVCIIVLILAVICQFPAYPQAFFSEVEDVTRRETMIGIWVAEVGGIKIALKLDESGTYVLQNTRGSYRIQGGMLILADVSGEERRYSLSFQGKEIVTITGGDLAQPLKFTRSIDTTATLKSLLRIDRQKLVGKVTTIAIIVVITFASRLLLAILNSVSAFLIFSEWSFFKFLYTENKNRKKTIHYLVLNVFKYVVYFTAIGFILAEIGVNSTAYLASLSVVGLAVGFGSQGLVQDIVTGFFLIFEGQFDVGDMVEISAQVGLVQELGMRMTKIQNYQGQIIFIPNRNIAVAGKYIKGSLEGYVDIALTEPNDFSRSKKCAATLSNELHRQFDDIFLSEAHAEQVLSLETEESFLRLHISIWPGQNWVIDQQLIPRIREQFARENIAIQSDRIVPFYHLRHEQIISTISKRIRGIRFLKPLRRKSKT